MAKTVEVALGEQTYSVPILNIGQIEQVYEIMETLPRYKVSHAVLRIAFQRVEPKVNVDAIEPGDESMEQIMGAAQVILKASGFKEGKSNGAADPRLAAA